MNFAEAMEISRRINDMAKSLCRDLCESVERLPFDGEYINDGKNGGPVMAVVKFSSLRDNWCPYYHLPAEQSRAVSRYLEQFKTAEGVCNAVKKILKEKRVPRGGFGGGGNSNFVFLNDRTVEAIEKSELGKYILSVGVVA